MNVSPCVYTVLEPIILIFTFSDKNLRIRIYNSKFGISAKFIIVFNLVFGYILQTTTNYYKLLRMVLTSKSIYPVLGFILGSITNLLDISNILKLGSKSSDIQRFLVRVGICIGSK